VVKQIQLEEIIFIFFDGLWSFKWCGEVGNALHLAIQANLPLATTTYHVPFYGFTLICYKYNMKLTITKPKA
jgi:hypothetical protein